MPQRYQKEIEDILEQSGKLRRVDGGAGSRIPFRRLVWLWLSRLARGRRWPQPGRLMLVAVCLLLSALLVRAVVPGIAGPLAWAGLLLFVLGYATFFVRPRGVEKRWRGQSIEEPRRSWWDRIRKKTG